MHHVFLKIVHIYTNKNFDTLYVQNSSKGF